MSNKLITVTLNPSLDRMMVAHYLAVGYHNRTSQTTRLEAGGRGVVTSHSLHALEAETHAIVVVGDDATARAYQALVVENPFPVTIVRRPGITRSNVMIIDTGNQNETRLIEESSGVNDDTIDAVIAELRGLIAAGDAVILAGSLPTDSPLDSYARLVRAAHDAGAIVAVDTYADPLGQALDAAPDLVVMHRAEAEALFNHPVRTKEDMIYCARRLHEQGVGDVLFPGGEETGTLLVQPDANLSAPFPVYEPGTFIGVKESIVAGYLKQQLAGEDAKNALALGAAAAAFTAEQTGIKFGSLHEVQARLEAIDVTVEDVVED